MREPSREGGEKQREQAIFTVLEMVGRSPSIRCLLQGSCFYKCWDRKKYLSNFCIIYIFQCFQLYIGMLQFIKTNNSVPSSPCWPNNHHLQGRQYGKQNKLPKNVSLSIRSAESWDVAAVNALPLHFLLPFSSLIVAADTIMGYCTVLHLRYTATFRT